MLQENQRRNLLERLELLKTVPISEVEEGVLQVDESSVELHAQYSELCRDLKEALSRLPNELGDIVSDYYGIGGKQLSPSEIVEKYKIHPTTVSRLVKDAQSLLKKRYSSKFAVVDLTAHLK